MKVIYNLYLTVKVDLKGSEAIIRRLFDNIEIDFNYTDDELVLDHDWSAFQVLNVDQRGKQAEVSLRGRMSLHYLDKPITEEEIKPKIEQLHRDLLATRTIGFWDEEVDCKPCLPFEITGYTILKLMNKPGEEIDEKLKALVIVQNETDMIIAISDGGITSSYHNEEHIILDLYQDRLLNQIANLEEMWEYLGEGKMYNQDFEQYQKINKEIILFGLNWLVVGFMGAKKDITELKIIRESDEKKIPKIINDLIFEKKYPRHKKIPLEDFDSLKFNQINSILAVLIDDDGDTEQIFLEKGISNPATSIIEKSGKINDIRFSEDEDILKIKIGNIINIFKINDISGTFSKKGNKYTQVNEKKIFAFYPNFSGEVVSDKITLEHFTNSIKQQCTDIEGELIQAQADYKKLNRERKKEEVFLKGKKKTKKLKTKSLLGYFDNGKKDQAFWLKTAIAIDDLDFEMNGVGGMTAKISDLKKQEKAALKVIKGLKGKVGSCEALESKRKKTEKKLGWVVSKNDVDEVDPGIANIEMGSMRTIQFFSRDDDWKKLGRERAHYIDYNKKSKKFNVVLGYTVNEVSDFIYGYFYGLSGGGAYSWAFFKLKHRGFLKVFTYKARLSGAGYEHYHDWGEPGSGEGKRVAAEDWECELLESLRGDLCDEFFECDEDNHPDVLKGKHKDHKLMQSDNFNQLILVTLSSYWPLKKKFTEANLANKFKAEMVKLGMLPGSSKKRLKTMGELIKLLKESMNGAEEETLKGLDQLVFRNEIRVYFTDKEIDDYIEFAEGHYSFDEQIKPILEKHNYEY